MFKIYEDNKLIEETTSGVLCAMYQAFRDNGCNIEDSLCKAKMVHGFWIKLDYPIDVNRLVDYICHNNIDLSNIDSKDMISNFNTI